LANHKSAIKRANQSEARRIRNRARKTRMKNALKTLSEAMSSQSRELTLKELKEAIAVIDRTASKGVIHRNKASRLVSQWTHKVNATLAEQGVSS
jgi:small subunit ribosomal protein S20